MLYQYRVTFTGDKNRINSSYFYSIDANRLQQTKNNSYSRYTLHYRVLKQQYKTLHIYQQMLQ